MAANFSYSLLFGERCWSPNRQYYLMQVIDIDRRTYALRGHIFSARLAAFDARVLGICQNTPSFGYAKRGQHYRVCHLWAV